MDPVQGFHLFDAYATAHPHLYALAAWSAGLAISWYWEAATDKLVFGGLNWLRKKGLLSSDFENALIRFAQRVITDVQKDQAEHPEHKEAEKVAALPPVHMDDPKG